MSPQVSAGGIADAQFFDEGGIAQPALLQIPHRLGMAVELQLVESGGFFQHVAVVGRRNVLPDVCDALAEREVLGELDKPDQITAAAATIAVEEILAGIDVERRP